MTQHKDDVKRADDKAAKAHGKDHADANPPGGVGARRPDEAAPELGGDVHTEQPASEPKDATREGAGAWTTPPPGQPPPGEQPPKGVPPESADPNKVPRVVNPNLRAGKGYARWKIRADISGSASKTLYILAKEDDEAGAKACYLHACGHDKKKQVLTPEGKIVENVVPMDLVVKKLPD